MFIPTSVSGGKVRAIAWIAFTTMLLLPLPARSQGANSVPAPYPGPAQPVPNPPPTPDTGQPASNPASTPVAAQPAPTRTKRAKAKYRMGTNPRNRKVAAAARTIQPGQTIPIDNSVTITNPASPEQMELPGNVKLQNLVIPQGRVCAEETPFDALSMKKRLGRHPVTGDYFMILYDDSVRHGGYLGHFAG
jgi:hypothetical protein